jgi:hypothetical protein
VHGRIALLVSSTPTLQLFQSVTFSQAILSLSQVKKAVTTKVAEVGPVTKTKRRRTTLRMETPRRIEEADVKCAVEHQEATYL